MSSNSCVPFSCVLSTSTLSESLCPSQESPARYVLSLISFLSHLDNFFDQNIFWSLSDLERRHIWGSTTSILYHNWRNCTPLSDRKVSGTPPLSLPLCIRSHRRCFWGQSLCSGTIHLEHWESILHTGGSCWYPQMFGFARRRSHCKLVLVSPPYNPTWSCPWRQTETGKPWSCLFWGTSRGRRKTWVGLRCSNNLVCLVGVLIVVVNSFVFCKIYF